jgi:hypothetical protein
MKKLFATLLVIYLVFASSQRATAQVTVSVDPGASWLGFMNVFELPANGGGYVFGSPWGVADLTATFSGPVLTLKPAPITTSDSFWYQGGAGGPGASGNKNMEANMYQEVTGPLAGVNLTFTGRVLSNTWESPYTTMAFIKDFAPDYSSNVTTTVPLNSEGVFSVSLSTINDPTRHVQFGFQTLGPNVWPTDVDLHGNIQIAAIPEPTTLAASVLGLVGLLAARRHRAR